MVEIKIFNGCREFFFFFQYATGQNRIGNMPKFSINECNEKLFKLPNTENLFDS